MVMIVAMAAVSVQMMKMAAVGLPCNHHTGHSVLDDDVQMTLMVVANLLGVHDDRGRDHHHCHGLKMAADKRPSAVEGTDPFPGDNLPLLVPAVHDGTP